MSITQLCSASANLIAVVAILIPLLIAWTLWFRWDIHQDPTDKLPKETIVASLAVFLCLVIVLGVLPWSSPLHEKEFDLWTILALSVGLAAYTSTILLDVRKAIRQAESSTPPNVDVAEKHRKDHAWLTPVDFILIAISLLLIAAIVSHDIYGCNQTLLLKVIEGLFLALVFYFAGLHYRQWRNHQQGNQPSPERVVTMTKAQAAEIEKIISTLQSDSYGVADAKAILEKAIAVIDLCGDLTQALTITRTMK